MTLLTLKPINRKLRSNRGETLTETLCSLLIIAIASAVFAVMVNAAIDSNNISDTQNDLFYHAVTVVESSSHTDAATAKTTITTSLSGKSVEFDIITHTFTDEASDKKLTAYEPIVSAEPADSDGEAGDNP